ncbi:porin [Photobacterium jeanii]|uniref:Porin n=1 Tax=Photobacterium jeanii TaxID=858640 RepID=A0A178KLT7_9GAMM|nr:porin [Photobacterium jeanii]OAN18096.1 porin [Photobacterium jeanii]PST92230.1 porin [Photobacterium jeanii]
MNKSFIALAVASVVAFPASAVEVYRDGDTSFSVGGRLAVRAEHTKSVGNEDSTNKLINSSSRINFGFTHGLVNDWVAGAKAEWGYNPVANGDQEFGNRLGNIYFAHDDAGLITVGKQWSVYYDVTGWTDVFWVYGGTASGTYDGRDEGGAAGGDGGVSGTGRADEAITYRNQFGPVKVGVQYQFENGSSTGDREYGLQGSVIYDIEQVGLSLGGTYGQTKYKGEEDDKVWSLAALYDNNNIYAAAQYGQYENHISFSNTYLAEKAKGYELIGAYTIQDMYQVYGGYNSVTDDNSDAELTYGLIGAAWVPANIVIALELKLGTKAKDNNGVDTGADQYALLARYNF